MNPDPNRKISDYRPDDLIPARMMAELIDGTSDQTWNAMRHKGTGPAFVKVCRKIYYRVRDINEWLDNNRMIRTDTPELPETPTAPPVKRPARVRNDTPTPAPVNRPGRSHKLKRV